MKRLLLFMATAAMFFVSCKPQENPVEPKLSVDKESVALEALEGSGTFSVTSNQDWTASADKDWVSIEPPTGKASDNAVSVTVTAEDNPATEARTATVTIKAGSLTETVSVTQAAAEPPVYELDGKQWVFDWEPLEVEALFDFGVTEAGKFYFAYDMAALAPSMAGIWYPVYQGTYTVEKGEELNAGVVKLVLVDPIFGEDLSFDMPYTLTAENAATFDTADLEDLLEVTSVSATAAAEKKELDIQEAPELPAEMDVVAVALAGEYYGGAGTYNYYFEVCDEEYLASEFTSGVCVAIDLWSDVPVGDGENIVPPGEYIFDPEDTYGADTFSNEYSAVMIDGMMVSILDGVVYVMEDGVEMELYLEGGTSLYVEYSGVPDMGSAVVGGGVSTLEGDLAIDSENSLIIAETYGDEWGIGMNYWYVSAMTEDGDIMYIELLSDGGLVGEYSVFDEDADEYTNGFVPGDYYAEVDGEDIYIEPMYTWWFETEMVDEEPVMIGGAPIVDGELVISESDGVYTFEFDFFDDKGNNIGGIISGEGEVYDYTEEPEASMAKSQSKNGRKAVAKKGFKAPAKTPIVLKKK